MFQKAKIKKLQEQIDLLTQTLDTYMGCFAMHVESNKSLELTQIGTAARLKAMGDVLYRNGLLTQEFEEDFRNWYGLFSPSVENNMLKGAPKDDPKL